MATTTLFAIANTAIVDRQTNHLSLIEVLDAIETPGLPVLIPKLTVVWIKKKEVNDPNSMLCNLEIRRNGEKSGEFPVAWDFNESMFHRSIAAITSFVIDQPGEIEFRITNAGKTLASCTLPVIVIGQDKETSHSTVTKKTARPRAAAKKS